MTTRLSREWTEALLAGVVVVLAYIALRLPLPVAPGAFHDDAVYLALGRALADGEGYRSIYLPGSPAHVKYPPGLPVLYALIWMVTGGLARTVSVITALNLGALGATAALLWHFARMTLRLRPWIIAMCTVAPLLLEAAVHVFRLPMSEPFFLLGWASALVLFARVVERPRARTALAVGLVLGVTLLFRTQALPLLAAAAIAALLHRLPKAAIGALTAGMVAPISSWYAIRRFTAGIGPTPSQPDDWSYFAFIPTGDPAAWPEFFINTWRTIGGYYWVVVPNMLAAPRVVGVVIVIGCLVGCVLGAALIGKRERFLTIGLVLSAATVVTWPFAQDRTVLVLLPFLGLLVGVALQRAFERATGRWRLAVAGSLLLAVGIVGIRQVEIRSHAGSWENAQAAVGFPYAGMVVPTISVLIFTANAWIEQHGRPSDVVMFEHGPAPFLTTGTRVVTFPDTDFVDQLPIFTHPGAYLARSVLDDSVSLVVISAEPQSDGGIAIADSRLGSEVITAFERCPASIMFAGLSGRYPALAFYRMNRNATCLEELRAPEIVNRPAGPRR